MKKKNVNSKLSFNKNIISQLDAVKGGIRPSIACSFLETCTGMAGCNVASKVCITSPNICGADH